MIVPNSATMLTAIITIDTLKVGDTKVRRSSRAKGQASSLYLFSYYAGSSVAGTLGGVFWHLAGWNGIGSFIIGMLVVALLVSLHLARLPVLPGNAKSA